jgi:hypothetical protein
MVVDNGPVKKSAEKLSMDGYQYYFHSQYPAVGPAVTIYYKCIHRKICKGRLSMKGGVIEMKEVHSCEMKEIKLVGIVDERK